MSGVVVFGGVAEGEGPGTGALDGFAQAHSEKDQGAWTALFSQSAETAVFGWPIAIAHVSMRMWVQKESAWARLMVAVAVAIRH